MHVLPLKVLSPHSVYDLKDLHPFVSDLKGFCLPSKFDLKVFFFWSPPSIYISATLQRTDR